MPFYKGYSWKVISKEIHKIYFHFEIEKKLMSKLNIIFQILSHFDIFLNTSTKSHIKNVPWSDSKFVCKTSHIINSK